VFYILPTVRWSADIRLLIWKAHQKIRKKTILHFPLYPDVLVLSNWYPDTLIYWFTASQSSGWLNIQGRLFYAKSNEKPIRSRSGLFSFFQASQGDMQIRHWAEVLDDPSQPNSEESYRGRRRHFWFPCCSFEVEKRTERTLCPSCLGITELEIK